MPSHSYPRPLTLTHPSLTYPLPHSIYTFTHKHSLSSVTHPFNTIHALLLQSLTQFALHSLSLINTSHSFTLPCGHSPTHLTLTIPLSHSLNYYSYSVTHPLSHSLNFHSNSLLPSLTPSLTHSFPHSPCLPSRLHVVGDGDVIRPDIILPLPEPQHPAHHHPGVDPDPHIQTLHPCLLPDLPAKTATWISYVSSVRGKGFKYQAFVYIVKSFCL